VTPESSTAHHGGLPPRRALWLAALLALLAYKTMAVLPLSPYAAFASVWVEAAFLGAALALADRIARSHPRRERLFSWSYGILVLVTSLFVASHAYFFASAAERRFSPLEVDLAAIWYFFHTVLPGTGYLALGSVLVGTLLLARWLTRVQGRIPLARWTHRLQLVLCLGALPWVAFAPRIASPLMDMAYGVREAWTTPKLRFDAGTPMPGSPSDLSRQDEPRHLGEPAFSRVLVFVMETMTAANFERERRQLPPRTFVNAMQPQARAFSRYFPSNQDSRTGMLGMLTSRLIPYEAYTEAGRDHYLYLSGRRSLVDVMHELGFQTAFAVSQNELELVVGDLPFQHRLNLDEQGLTRARAAGHLCFVPYQFEHSCEDLALLPRVLELIDRHPRLFLYQEFIWGHAVEYNEASGKSNTEYYSAYLDAVVEHLRARGLLEDTLIVLTSDHGFRDTSLQGEPEVVRIPLYFWSARFPAAPARPGVPLDSPPGEARDSQDAATDDGLYAHMDFKGLLMHQLFPSEPAPPPRAFTLVVGPTGSSLVLALSASRELMLLKTNERQHLLLRHVQLDAQGNAREALDAPERAAGYLKLFYDYRARFDAEGSAPTPSH
jgi:hypothetical protein